MKIAVLGAHGFVGSFLCPYLEKLGNTVQKIKRSGNLGYTLTSLEFEGVDAVINLAGAPITSRWTEETKEEIRASRVETTKSVVEAIRECKSPPKVLLNASAIGYYGDRGSETLDEESKKGEGFLSDVVEEWESEANKAPCRVVLLRFGVILSKDGGALHEMLTPFRFGLGGKFGDGKQYMSFVSIDDVLRAIVFALENETLSGPVNVVSPNPVQNSVYTKALGKTLRRPTFFSVPRFLLTLTLGEMAEELFLASDRCLPKKLLTNRFQFRHDEIGKTLKALIGGENGV